MVTTRRGSGFLRCANRWLGLPALRVRPQHRLPAGLPPGGV